MSDNSILLKGIAIMALLSIVAGLYVAATMPGSGSNERYTAVYMNTSGIDRNITKDQTTLTVPVTIENHEGQSTGYGYSVSIFFKNTVFHGGTNPWSEDLNVDQKLDVLSGNVTLDNGTAQTIELSIPVVSDQIWRYANVSIDFYKDGTPGVYRSLRLWASYQN